MSAQGVEDFSNRPFPLIAAGAAVELDEIIVAEQPLVSYYWIPELLKFFKSWLISRDETTGELDQKDLDVFNLFRQVAAMVYPNIELNRSNSLTIADEIITSLETLIESDRVDAKVSKTMREIRELCIELAIKSARGISAS